EESGWNKRNTEDSSGSLTVEFTAKKSTKVYLPAGATWYDFHTNEKHDGGQEITKETTIHTIPLYVKAGSIIPFGPKVQYATEKAWDNLEIRIYPGADGEFTLYEDEFDNYNYEKGFYTTITFKWNDRNRTLTVGDRKGSFPGMLNNRTFNIVIDGDTKTVSYSGKQIKVKL
ncbi:MAG: DUF5110 domain-containing protein, partial [Dysgonamonadaceae bacterium]|nr:DUF5110 domain-containing protein [Dysgonamonadaceae bacterium]